MLYSIVILCIELAMLYNRYTYRLSVIFDTNYIQEHCKATQEHYNSTASDWLLTTHSVTKISLQCLKLRSPNHSLNIRRKCIHVMISLVKYDNEHEKVLEVVLKATNNMIFHESK